MAKHFSDEFVTLQEKKSEPDPDFCYHGICWMRGEQIRGRNKKKPELHKLLFLITHDVQLGMQTRSSTDEHR